MTLIIAMVSKEGIVMASDSASTDTDAGTKQPTNEKISYFNQSHVLLGTAGDVGLSQKIKHKLKNLSYQSDHYRLRNQIKEVITGELKESNRTHVPYPAGAFAAPPDHVCIACGYAKDGPFLFEYERDGRDTDYAPLNMGGFVAIGSGKFLAHALYRPHFYTEKKLNEARVIAYRILEDSIEIAAFGLARPIHLYEMTPGGKWRKMETADIKGISDSVQIWRSIEQESIGKALSPKQSLSGENGIPTPES
jgi:20S proteasome alpha/beta subunit